MENMEDSITEEKNGKKELTFIYKFKENGESFEDIINRIVISKLLKKS